MKGDKSVKRKPKREIRERLEETVVGGRNAPRPEEKKCLRKEKGKGTRGETSSSTLRSKIAVNTIEWSERLNKK